MLELDEHLHGVGHVDDDALTPVVIKNQVVVDFASGHFDSDRGDGTAVIEIIVCENEEAAAVAVIMIYDEIDQNVGVEIEQ